MSSALGQLPEFGSGRGLSTSLNRRATDGGLQDLDNDLESLLGDNSGKSGAAKTGGRQKSKAPKTRAKESTSNRALKSDSDNFYGQMAALANEDVDNDEEDELLTAADSKKLADSFDLDDMDANLFGSFSRSQNQKRRQSSSRKNSLPSKPTPEGGVSQRNAVTEPESVVSSTKDKMASSSKDSGKSSEAKSILKTPGKSSSIKSLKDYDDLLDLLSDSGDEDQAPKKREKPKIQLKSKPKPETSTSTATPPSILASSEDTATPPSILASSEDTATPPSTLANSEDTATLDDGKPITSIKNTINENYEDKFERLRTSRGKQESMDTKSSSDAISAPIKESRKSSSGANVLTVDYSLKQSTPTGSLNSTQINFDDDEGDDLLSGMGLDDSDVIGPAKQPGKGKSERRGSVLDELLGRKSSASKATKENSESKSSDTKAKKLWDDDKADSDGEGEGFQFGGYVPSAAGNESTSTSTQAKKPRLKVPLGRRGFSELTLPPDTLTARPGSAPSPVVKKSVRFADTVETSDRPSSSPATSSEGGVSKAPPTSGSLSNQRTATSSDKEEASSTSKQSSEVAKKPPLPRRSSAISDKTKESGDGEFLETGGDIVQDEDKVGQDGGGGSKESENDAQNQSISNGSDSLFPSNESTPKKAPVRGKGRRTSLTKPPPSSTGSLFQEEPQTTDNADIGLSDETPLTQEEGMTVGVAKSLKLEERKLERPVFPWQKGRQTRSQSLGSTNVTGSPSRKGSGMAGDHMTSRDPPKGSMAADHVTTSHDPIKRPAAGDHMTASHDPILDQSSQLASFQEMLLQQQRQMQEQFKQSLQAQLGGVTTAPTAKLSKIEEDQLRSEQKSSIERTKELEIQLEMEKSKCSEAQKKVKELEQQLQSVGGERKKFEVEVKEHRDKISELENRHQKVQMELASQLEDTKMKLHRVELERTQLQYSVESANSRHTEEVEAIQKSHDSRIKTMEESFHRRETRWREEAESEASRHQEKLQQVEREKMDAVLALKKKIDALEVSKTNEISRSQDVHRTSIEDLKREHEQDKHHLLSMHRQEVEALKAAHSHTRMLSELTHQVESSTREVSQLQAKLEQAHSMRVDEQAQRTKIHQEQLKTLEERLVRQQAENSAERERLHLLIAKLESHIAQQGKTIDQEKWQLQQDTSRLKTQQSAFEEERASFLRKIVEDREQIQQAREKFLLEQREVLGKCYEERRRLATERAELEVVKKRARERDERDSLKSLQIEAELEASRSHIQEESARINSEMAQLRQDQLRVRTESEAIAKERERLDKLAKEVDERSQEAKKLNQSALAMKEKGEQSLHEAKNMRDQLESRSKAVEQRMMELKEEEKKVAIEQLSLTRQKRDLHELQLGAARDSPLEMDNDDDIDAGQNSRTSPSPIPPPTSDSMAVPTVDHNQPHSTTTTTLPPISHHHASLTSLDSYPLLSSSAPVQITNQVRHHRGGLGAKLHVSGAHHCSNYSNSKRYSPASSPSHSQHPMVMSMLGSGRQSVQSELAQIEHTRNLRQLALLAEQDYQDLEEEARFLETLQSSGRHHYSKKLSPITTMN